MGVRVAGVKLPSGVNVAGGVGDVAARVHTGKPPSPAHAHAR